MNLEELRRRARELRDEGVAITEALAANTATEEQRARVAPLMQELREVNDQIDEVEQSTRRAGELRDLISRTEGTSTAAGAAQAAGVLPGALEEVRSASAGQQAGFRAPSVRSVLASEQWQQFAASGGRGNSHRFLLPHPTWDTDREARDLSYIPSQARAVFSLADNAGLNPANRLPGILRGTGPRPLRVRDLMNQGRTDSPIIELLIELSRTNNAATVAESTTATPANKPESTLATQVKTFVMSTIAHWTQATRQSLHNNAFLESYMEELLREGIFDVEDAQLIEGNGTAPNVRGIKNVSGINNLNAAYWTANPLPAGGTNLDRLRRAKTVVSLASRRQVDAFLVSPAQLEIIETMKDADGRYLLQRGGPDQMGVSTLWGVPVYQQEDLDATEAIAASWRTMWVFDNMDVALFATDSHASNFIQNIITFLAEEYIIFVPTVPSAIAVVTLA